MTLRAVRSLPPELERLDGDALGRACWELLRAEPGSDALARFELLRTASGWRCEASAPRTWRMSYHGLTDRLAVLARHGFDVDRAATTLHTFDTSYVLWLPDAMLAPHRGARPPDVDDTRLQAATEMWTYLLTLERPAPHGILWGVG